MIQKLCDVRVIRLKWRMKFGLMEFEEESFEDEVHKCQI